MKKKVIQKNKQGLFNYEILDTFEAGVVLSGPEVKSVKNGHLSLKGSYVTIDNNEEVWLVNAHIAPYEPAATHQKDYQPDGKRKLLLHKKQIASLIGKSKQKGLTIIPMSVYTTRRLIKLEIGLARGKTEIDKRESIKKREIDRQIRRSLKH